MKKTIMMVGPFYKSRGGIASVINGYYESGLIEKLCIKYCATYRDGTKIWKLLFYLFALLKIAISLFEIKILHVHTASKWSFRRLSVILTLGIILNKKIIIHLHGGGFENYFKKASTIEKIWITKIFRNATKVIVLANNQVQVLSDLLNIDHVVVIPNSIFISKKDISGINNDNKKVLNLIYLGALVKRKGIYDLLQAIKKVSEKFNNFRLILCGEGEFEKVKRTIDSLDIGQFVIMLGWVDKKVKEDVLNSGHILVLPSYVEAFPMCLLEAMAKGIPVIATSVGGVRDIVDDGINGFIIRPGNVEMLTQKIESLMKDKKLRLKMGSSSYEKVSSKFSIDKTIDRMRILYQSICTP